MFGESVSGERAFCGDEPRAFVWLFNVRDKKRTKMRNLSILGIVSGR